MNMANLLTLAAAVPSKSVQATGWFLETAWLIPALPALSFFLILFFGKKMKYKGAESVSYTHLTLPTKRIV